MLFLVLAARQSACVMNGVTELPSLPRDELIAQLEPLVRDTVLQAGFELEELDIRQAGRRQLVRVIVDGDGGIGLDDIAEVSRSVSAALDAKDAILASAYTLEVTSPGLDRPLIKPRHWRRHRLRLVKVSPVEGAEFIGRIGNAEPDENGAVELLIDGEVRTVSYSQIRRAMVEIEFRQPPVDELKMLDRQHDADNTKGEER